MNPAALFATIALTLPWLNPFASGPSPAVVPWLVSLGCAALALASLAMSAWRLTPVSRVSPRASRTPGTPDPAPLNSSKLAQITATAWLTAALLSAAIALLQYFGVANLFEPWVNTTQTGEAYANLRQRNQFASLTNIGLLALLWWVAQGPTAWSGRPRGQVESEGERLDAINLITPIKPMTVRPALPQPWQTGQSASLTIAAAALLAIGNAASSSRTGLLQLGAIVVMVGFWGGFKTPKTRLVLISAVLAYAVASAVLPPLAGLEWGTGGILGRLNEPMQACSSRRVLWANVLHLIGQNPWFGWGWGELDFAHFITLYPGYPGGGGARFCDIADNAHNLPLHLAVELGIPRAVLICGTGLWLVWRGQPWREKDATRQMAWAVLGVIGVHSLLEYPLWYGPFQIAAVLCLCLLLPAGVRLKLEEIIATTRHWKAWSASFLIAFMLSFTAYAGWDYHRISQIYLAPNLRSAAYQANTLAKIKNSWLFQSQVQFAELTTTTLTADNAAHVNALALALLHFSPEAQVAVKLIDSAVLLGKYDEAAFFEARLKAAFPDSAVRRP